MDNQTPDISQILDRLSNLIISNVVTVMVGRGRTDEDRGGMGTTVRAWAGVWRYEPGGGMKCDGSYGMHPLTRMVSFVP